jgi:hypothetical protein
MQKTSKILSAMILVFALFHLAIPAAIDAASTDKTIPAEAWTAAAEGLRMFHSQGIANPEKWGFASAEEAGRLTLGEGYRIAYIGKSAYSTSDMTSLLATEDSLLFPTWLFTVNLDSQPKSFVMVYRPDGEECQLAGFGGDATYFEIALDVIRRFASDTVVPILMQFRSQYFMVLERNGKESVLPVPYDVASSAIVASGHGFVEPAAVIGCIKAQPGNDSSEKTRGDSYLDVWNYSGSEQSWRGTIANTVIIVASICIGFIVGGVVTNRARQRRMQRLLESTLGQSNGRMASTRPRRKAAGTHPTLEREWGNRPFQ